MKRFLPAIIACCVLIPACLLIGLLAGATFGQSAGIVGVVTIVLVAAYTRKTNAAKKLQR